MADSFEVVVDDSVEVGSVGAHPRCDMHLDRHVVASRRATRQAYSILPWNRSVPGARPVLDMAAPFHEMSRETFEMMRQYTCGFTVDDSAFRAGFGAFETIQAGSAAPAALG